MFRCQVCIAHRHGQAAVTKDFLQHQNIPAVHDEVAYECVTENMRQLTSSAINASSIGTERFLPDFVPVN
jgi:hypothetical protein